VGDSGGCGAPSTLRDGVCPCFRRVVVIQKRWLFFPPRILLLRFPGPPTAPYGPLHEVPEVLREGSGGMDTKVPSEQVTWSEVIVVGRVEEVVSEIIYSEP